MGKTLIEPLYNAVNLVELAVEKGAASVLMPVSHRQQLVDLSVDMATKAEVPFYLEARAVQLKVMME